jgi:glutathione S-transferase
MITVYKYVSAWGLPDISPFCSKLEIYLRMAGWPYQTKVGNPRQAPKGKLPYIEHEGRTLCDSSDIIAYLEARADHPRKRSLDAGLSARDQAVGVALQSMLEEHFYYVTSWRRWADPAAWAQYRPIITSSVAQAGAPGWMAPLIVPLIRRDVVKAIHKQGMGRHSPAEINAIGVKLLTAVSGVLGDQAYVLGDQPRTVDATVYAFLAGTLAPPIEGPVKEIIETTPNLRAYCARMKAQFWTEEGGAK